jgi:hypothetical protein
MPSGLHSMSSTGMGARSTSAASLEKACADKPWKERVQSTWREPSSRIRGSSAKPVVRSVRGVCSFIESELDATGEGGFVAVDGVGVGLRT